MTYSHQQFRIRVRKYKGLWLCQQGIELLFFDTWDEAIQCGLAWASRL